MQSLKAPRLANIMLEWFNMKSLNLFAYLLYTIGPYCQPRNPINKSSNTNTDSHWN